MRTETLIGSATDSPDRYDRLPEGERDKILELKNGNHRVKEAQLIDRNAGDVPDTGVEPPAQGPNQIEIECTLYPEARLIHSSREALPGVSARVSKLSIEGPEQLLEGGHQDYGAASALQ